MADDLVECRVPTCRRPELLRRALRSLQAQTHANWRAVVLDDSPEREGRAVVAALADPRVEYRPNPHPLLATGNLDQAFQTAPLAGGQYAFVLEDDNAIEAGFMQTGLRRLARGDLFIVSFNQRSVRFDGHGSAIPIGDLRPPTVAEQIWTRDRLWLNAFLTVSLPNGGYFWRLGRGVDLTVGTGVREPQLQECIRQTCVAAIALVPEPYSIWSYLPPANVRRQVVSHRRFATTLNALSKRIVSQMGEARLCEAARRDADPGLLLRVNRSLAELSLMPPRHWRHFFRAPLAAVRLWLRHQLHPTAPPLDRIVYPAP